MSDMKLERPIGAEWANGTWQSDEVYMCPECKSLFSMVRSYDADTADELGYEAPSYCPKCGEAVRP